VIGERIFLGSFQKQHLLEQAPIPQLHREALPRICPPHTRVLSFPKENENSQVSPLGNSLPSHDSAGVTDCNFTYGGMEPFYGI